MRCPNAGVFALSATILLRESTSVNPVVQSAATWYAALLRVVTDALEDAATIRESVTDHESTAFGLWEDREVKAIILDLEKLLATLQTCPPNLGTMPRL